MQLENLEHQQLSSVSIDASYGYHPDCYSSVSRNRKIELHKVRHLEIGGETAFLTDISLSNFPGLKDLFISTDIFPLEDVTGKPILLNRLVISGMYDVSLEPGLRFHRFLQRVSFETLLKLTICETSLWKVKRTSHLKFDYLTTLELLGVTNPKAILQQDFPRLRNVSFSTSRRKEVNAFLTSFVSRHSSHLLKVLIRRRLEKKLLCNGSKPCLTSHRYEVLSPRAIKALLACSRLQVFALEGRVYFRPEDWETFCTEEHTSTLTQVYITPPNALVQAEVPFKVRATLSTPAIRILTLLTPLQSAREVLAPVGLMSYHDSRLFFRQPLNAAWCKEAVLNRNDERRQFLREVDPMHDFTETSKSSSDMSLDDILQMLESERTDVCVCRPGSQKHDLSSDSEEECSTASDNDSLGPASEMIQVAHRGWVYHYEPWALCPSIRSKSKK